MSDKLSQEDIDTMLSENSPEDSLSAQNASAGGFKYLDLKEVDTIGEIGNISMGSSATTLSMLLGNKVEITTPRVEEHEKVNEVLDLYRDYVAIEIKYKSGLSGTTVFVLQKEDTAVIADLMMGGDGKIKNAEIGELQLSAVGEAMNQMIGTSATTLSSMFHTNIDITAPDVKFQKAGSKLDLSEEISDKPIISTSFKLIVGDLINSEMVQIMSLDSAKSQISKLMNSMNDMLEDVVASIADERETPYTPPMDDSLGSPSMLHEKPITVQPVQFTSFNDISNIYGESGKNLDLLMDVKLSLTVELGRTELPIKKVLELTRGSVIELDKIAGEPVDLYANGKLIARGEVVVIEDNFGLRITGIVSPDNRLKGL